MIKSLFQKYLKYFIYFYKHLGYRVLVAFLLTGVVGILDGFGIAMVLPLLQMIDGTNEFDPEVLGNMRFITDFIANMGFELNIKTILLAMLVFFFLKGIARHFDLYYRVRLRFFFMKKLRFENVEMLKGFSFKYFVLSDSGRIQNTLSGEVARIVSSYTNYFNMMHNVMLVAVYFLLAALANVQLAMIVAIGGLIVNVAYRTFFKKSKQHSKDITTHGHGFQGLLIQMVAFFKYLKSTASINQFGERLKVKVEEIEKSNRKIGFLNSFIEASREPMIMLLVTAIIFIQVLIFGQGLGPIILALALLYRALNSFMFVQVQWNLFLSGAGAIDNMNEFMDEMSANQETYAVKELQNFSDKITLKDVTFSYTDEPVLKRINLEIKKNETIAFVGESGSGKTTLVNLLSGLLIPDSGEIRVDGTDLTEIDIRTYQKRIGYITQEAVIFSDTIFNNVTFWSDDNPENEEKFWRALQEASIDDFVRSLPQGKYAQLGINGILVSGGQKQRLSIARELYKNADIIIMDEATSALDSETEKTIQENIDTLKGSCTFFIVAHRLSTVRNADKIVLMRGGRVKDVGNFKELISVSPEFRRMVELQEI